MAYANAEFDKFKKLQVENKSLIEKHFEQAIKNLDQIEDEVLKKDKTKK